MISADELWGWYERDRFEEYYDRVRNNSLDSLARYNRKVGELEMLKLQREYERRWLGHHTQVIHSGDLDKAFNLDNPNCIKYSCYDDHYKYQEDLAIAEQLEKELEWHHIPPVEKEDGVVYAERIEELLGSV